MKKIVLLICALSMMNACKNTSEEVKVDETKVENPADTIVEKDTIAVKEYTTPAAADPEPEMAAVVPAPVEKINYATFGRKISPDKALTSAQMLKKYQTMKAGDTVAVAFKSKIHEVCKKKGCWMSMELPNKKESFVRFKDYAFFVPLNADNSEAIVNGKAYIDVVSVAELQHYAKDGGKSQEEIEKITEPKITYAFQADGVLIRE
jgi:hypothetical protein